MTPVELLARSGRPCAAPLVYHRVSAPAVSPVDLARVRRHLRIDEADVDDVEADLITAAIAAATEHLDGRTGVLNRALVTQTWQATTDRPAWNVVSCASGFLVDFGPLQAVTKVEGLAAGEYAELPAEFWRVVSLPGGRAAVIPTLGRTWPAVDRDPQAWRLTLRVGYGDAGDAVPAPIRSAILLMVADLFDNRDGKVQANLVDNPTIDRLLQPYRRLGV